MRLFIASNDLLVYATAVAQPTGIQRVGAGLAEALLSDPSSVLVVVDRSGARRIEPTQAGIGTRSGTRRASARIAAPLLALLARAPRGLQETVRGRARRLLAARAEQAGVPIGIGADDWIAVIGAPWIAPGMAEATIALKRRSGARVALLVHDLLPITTPEWYADRQSVEARDDVTALVEAADRIFAVSPAVADEIRSRFGRAAASLPPADPILATKATVEHMPSSFDGRESGSAETPLREQYILFVGTLHPRKRVASLVRAIATIAERNGIDAAPRLVIAGRRHPQDGELFAVLEECATVPGLRERIVLIHDADDARLAELYARARFVVLPSLAEGWGIPVREALLSGRPIIATDAVPAAVGSPFASIVPAGDDAALCAAVERWWKGDEPERLSARIRSDFVPRSWIEVAREFRSGLTEGEG